MTEAGPRPQASGTPGGVRPSDVQRFGLLSAAAVVARYAEAVDRTISGTGTPTPGNPDSMADGLTTDGLADGIADGATRLTQAALRFLDAGAALVRRTEEALAPAVPERLEPPPTPAGSSTGVSVWVHNPTSTAAEVSLHATSLVSASGAVLPADAVECRPCGGVPVPPLGSGEVRVRIAVPTGQPAGRYHGLLVGSTAAEPLPLLVIVTSVLREVPP